MANKTTSKGMTKGKKIALAFGSVIVLAGLGYWFYRNNKYKKLKEECIAKGGIWDEKTKICNFSNKKVESKAQNDLLFQTAKAIIQPSSYPSLDELAKFLNDNKSFNLSLVGHTDNQGSDELNLKLSKGRANAVKTYLEGKGIESLRITTDGKGETEPIATNDTEQGRQQNRRVVFKMNNG